MFANADWIIVIQILGLGLNTPVSGGFAAYNCQNVFCPSNRLCNIHASDTGWVCRAIIPKLDFVQSISYTIHQFLKATPFSKINLVWFPSVSYSQFQPATLSEFLLWTPDLTRFYYWYRDCYDIRLLMCPCPASPRGQAQIQLFVVEVPGYTRFK